MIAFKTCKFVVPDCGKWRIMAANVAPMLYKEAAEKRRLGIRLTGTNDSL